MSARTNPANHLVWLGRRKNKLHVLRRLFHNLEHCVEALGRHHVSLIEDEDLETVAGRSEHSPLAQVTGIFNTVVACSVNLDNIERPTTISRELNTRRTDTTGSVGRALCAVEAASQNAGGCRLAAASRTAKEIGVIDPIGA